MRSFLPVLSLFALAVSAGPLLFDNYLLKHGDVQGRLSVLKHQVYHLDEETKPVGFAFGASVPVLRFLYLVPKFAKVASLSENGFVSKHFGEGHEPKLHKFTVLPSHELLVDLVGLSDCRTFQAVLLKVYDVGAGLVTPRALGGELVEGKFNVFPLADVTELAHFVHTKAGLFLLKGLLKKPLPAHVFTHALLAKVRHLL